MNKSYIAEALKKLTEILGKKGDDYTSTSEFENFLEQARVAEIQVRQVFRGMLAQKLLREKTTHAKGSAANEPRIDSVLDLAGYSVLFYAWELYQADIEQGIAKIDGTGTTSNSPDISASVQ